MTSTYKTLGKSIAVGQVITFSTAIKSGNREIISEPCKGKVTSIVGKTATVDCSTLYCSKVLTIELSQMNVKTVGTK